MAAIIKTIILKQSEAPTPVLYEINTAGVRAKDHLRVEFSHEEDPEVVFSVYKMPGRELESRNSVHFSVLGKKISWLGAQPERVQ